MCRATAWELAPEGKEIRQNLGYLMQESLKQTHAKEGPEKTGEMLEYLLKRFPDVPEVTRAAEGFYDRWAFELARRKEWPAAVEVYATVTSDQWAKSFFKTKDWEGAMQVYEKALRQFPNHKLVKQNMAYCKNQKKK
jgi:hypothetical protein